MKNHPRLLVLVLLFLAQVTESLGQNGKLDRMAFGSCNRQDAPQPLWSPIFADRPDLWIWMGDNIYGDSPVMDTLSAKYNRQNVVVDYQAIKTNVSITGESP